MKIKTNGIEIHCQVLGDSGPWVTLSHSLACNLHMWDPQAKLFSSRYRVLAFDTRGHGESDAPAGAYTLEQMADDVAGLLDGLKIDKTHFVGLSMGGMIGQVFALKYPLRLSSLVLCDTTSRFPAGSEKVWEDRINTVQAQGLEPMVAPTLARWFTEGFRASRSDVTGKIAAMIRATPVAGYIGCCHAVPMIHTTAHLKEIRCPTLVMVGKDDPGTPVAMAEAIQREIAGSRLTVIPSASHLCNLEQPEAFNRALMEFLDGLSV
ncbi:MAG: 3-oxoadipate enol-lactonase [Betaproteobacteria bacterium]|nr:3-oxoadipate enol-lactonase [Betaproteobacteria bacterium]